MCNSFSLDGRELHGYTPFNEHNLSWAEGNKTNQQKQYEKKIDLHAVVFSL